MYQLYGKCRMQKSCENFLHEKFEQDQDTLIEQSFCKSQLFKMDKNKAN